MVLLAEPLGSFFGKRNSLRGLNASADLERIARTFALDPMGILTFSDCGAGARVLSL